MIVFYKIIIIALIFFRSNLYTQIYFSADPYYLMEYELKQFNNTISYHSTTFRPFYMIQKNKNISLSVKNEFFINNNAPNQENMDVRYIGNGFGSFTSVLISGYSKFLAFNLEPYKLTSNYYNFKEYKRSRPFNFLNDAKTNKDLKSIGLRKANIYVHYNGFAIGLSNDNMWWGPGLQSTLSMTNNTVGFNNFMVGSIRELRWKNISIMGRYTFSELNNEKDWKSIYFTSLTGQLTFYSEQILTFGFSRNYLTGGADIGVPWTKSDARKIVFEGVFIKNLQKLDYTIAGHDRWDQTLSTWFELSFPKNKLKLFIEIGFNDNRFNLWDFIVQPDHSMASIIGFRKYGFLNRDNIIFGFEYANLIQGRHHIFRASPNWYDRSHYNDFSYEGRRWGAHSGSDSDDILIYFGLMNEKWAIVPALNFERHGVTTYRPAEIKFEFKIDARYKINDYEFGIYYENQFEAHLGFPPDQYFIDEITGKRRTNTFIIKILKNLY